MRKTKLLKPRPSLGLRLGSWVDLWVQVNGDNWGSINRPSLAVQLGITQIVRGLARYQIDKNLAITSK